MVYPEPRNWHGANGPVLDKKSETGKVSNDTATNSTANTTEPVAEQPKNASLNAGNSGNNENCTTHVCTCKKACAPKLVASVSFTFLSKDLSKRMYSIASTFL